MAPDARVALTPTLSHSALCAGSTLCFLLSPLASRQYCVFDPEDNAPQKLTAFWSDSRQLFLTFWDEAQNAPRRQCGVDACACKDVGQHLRRRTHVRGQRGNYNTSAYPAQLCEVLCLDQKNEMDSRLSIDDLCAEERDQRNNALPPYWKTTDGHCEPTRRTRSCHGACVLAAIASLTHVPSNPDRLCAQTRIAARCSRPHATWAPGWSTGWTWG